MPEETAQNPTFDQAAEQAMATLAEPAVVEESTGDTNTATEQPSEQPPVEAQADDTTESDELLTDEEVATLDVAGQANYKKMQKAFTEKTQKLAAERKEYEAYKQYKSLIDAYNADPDGTIKQLASQRGITLAEAAKTQEPVKVSPEESEVTKTQLRQLLGEGNEELADGLAKIIDSRAVEIANSRVKPIEERQTEALKKAATEAADADLKAFEKVHPDFKKYEAQMQTLATKFQPAEGAKMGVSEYLEMLYKVASMGDSEASKTQKVIERINKAAASSEPKESAVPTSKVTPARPKRPTLEEAFEAAKQGIAW